MTAPLTVRHVRTLAKRAGYWFETLHRAIPGVRPATYLLGLGERINGSRPSSSSWDSRWSKPSCGYAPFTRGRSLAGAADQFAIWGYGGGGGVDDRIEWLQARLALLETIRTPLEEPDQAVKLKSLARAFTKLISSDEMRFLGHAFIAEAGS